MRSDQKEAMAGLRRRPRPLRHDDTHWRPTWGGLRKPYLPLSLQFCSSVGRTADIDCPLVSDEQIDALRAEHGSAGGDFWWSDRLSRSTRLSLIATAMLSEDRRRTRAAAPKRTRNDRTFATFTFQLPTQWMSSRRFIPVEKDRMEAMLLNPRCNRVLV